MSRSIRQKRVADLLQAKISTILQTEMRDPRLTLVTVTKINVDRELEYANVWVCAPQGNAREAEVMTALKKAAGFIRHQVAQGVRLRKMPQLRFHWDLAPDQTEYINQVLDSLEISTNTDLEAATPNDD